MDKVTVALWILPFQYTLVKVLSLKAVIDKLNEFDIPSLSNSSVLTVVLLVLFTVFII
nr:MAG TPA: hypothetical protein [Caudoviricetes sp.]